MCYRMSNLCFDLEMSLRNQRFTSNISVTVIGHSQNVKNMLSGCTSVSTCLAQTWPNNIVMHS